MTRKRINAIDLFATLGDRLVAELFATPPDERRAEVKEIYGSEDPFREEAKRALAGAVSRSAKGAPTSASGPPVQSPVGAVTTGRSLPRIGAFTAMAAASKGAGTPRRPPATTKTISIGGLDFEATQVGDDTVITGPIEPRWSAILVDGARHRLMPGDEAEHRLCVGLRVLDLAFAARNGNVFFV